MTIRTVCILLGDGTTVCVPEPDWCAGEHTQGGLLADVMHDSAPVTLTVATDLGPATFLEAALSQTPYAVDLSRRLPRVTVLLDGEWSGFDPAGVASLADGLTRHAGALRALGAELAGLLQHGR